LATILDWNSGKCLVIVWKLNVKRVSVCYVIAVSPKIEKYVCILLKLKVYSTLPVLNVRRVRRNFTVFVIIALATMERRLGG